MKSIIIRRIEISRKTSLSKSKSKSFVSRVDLHIFRHNVAQFHFIKIALADANKVLPTRSN